MQLLLFKMICYQIIINSYLLSTNYELNCFTILNNNNNKNEFQN